VIDSLLRAIQLTISIDHVVRGASGRTPLVLLHSILWVKPYRIHQIVDPIYITFSDNQPAVTEAIKMVLKDDYNYDSTVPSSPP
jgi:hypothetical protein